MPYDLAKYREKREKVLGVKKRGIGFAAAAALVSFAILLGLSALMLPKAIDFFANRHLEDAIYKWQGGGAWSEALSTELKAQKGVRQVSVDTGGTRLLITFDRRLTDPNRLATFFDQQAIPVALLNQVDHRHRRHIMEKEAKAEGRSP